MLIVANRHREISPQSRADEPAVTDGDGLVFKEMDLAFFNEPPGTL